MARRSKRSHPSETAPSGTRAPFDSTKHRRGQGGRFSEMGGGASGGRGGAVAQAHAVFNKLAGRPRAEVLAAATAVGINRNTASTQFYHWQRARAASEAARLGPNPTKADLQQAAARALGVQGAPRAPATPAPRPQPATNPYAMQPGERPVAALHRIADAMRDRPRSEVIATAVAAGVNRSTASVQYSAWVRRQAAAPARPAPAAVAPVAARPTASGTRAQRTPRTPATAPAAPQLQLTRVTPVAAHASPPAAQRALIKDNTAHVPPAARALHDKLHRAASVFKEAEFTAEYSRTGELVAFHVRRSSVNNPGAGVVISRSFSKGVVDHSYFSIGNTERRTGAAKSFLAETVKAYQEHGYTRVEVHANIDVGGYAWLRYGFKPKARSQGVLRNKIVSALGYGEVHRTLGQEAKAQLLRMADSGNFNEIAAMTTPITMADGTSRPLGKVLFMNTNWYGHLPLKNKNAMKTFFKYAGASE